MSWWERIGAPAPHEAPGPRPTGGCSRSVYEDPDRWQHTKAARWVQVAAEDPITGDLQWKEDWPRLVTGWRPLHEFIRDRWRWS